MSGTYSIGDLRGTISLQDTFSGPLGQVAGAIGLSGESFRAMGALAAGAVGAIAATTGAIVALGMRGSDVADVQTGFNQLSTAAGSTAEVMLGALQTGVQGTMTNFDLMKASAGVLGSGLIRTSGDMETLAAGARLLANRTGGETSEAFNTLTSAMASGRVTQLRQLGVFVDTDVAVANFARSIGTVPGKLTDAQRATAIAHATLAALRGQLQGAGPDTLDFADRVQQGKVAVGNFTDNLGMAIARSPVIIAGMTAVGSALQGAFGGSNASMVTTLMGYVNTFAIGLTYAGQVGAVAATVLVTAWSAIQVVVLAVITAVAATGTAIVSLVSGLAEMAAKIPGLGSSVQGFAEGSHALASELATVTNGLAAQTAAAAEGVIGHGALHQAIDGVSGGLMNIREKMEAAAGASANLDEKAKPVPTTLRDVGISAAAAAAAIEQMATGAGTTATYMGQTADEILAKQQELQNQLTLATVTGTQARLVELTLAREAEIAGLQEVAFAYPAVYEGMVAAVNEKYQRMASTALGVNSQIAASATGTGVLIRGDLDETQFKALEAYDTMLGSALFAFTGIATGHRAMSDAVTEIDRTVAHTRTELALTAMASASGILRSIFGQNKNAAIAAAIIDTAAAIVRSMREYPMPFALIPMAAAAAAGGAQIAAIRSQSYAQGTEGFEQFGRGSLAMLHGQEEVVPKAKGESLAEMLGSVIHGADARTAAMMERLDERAAARDRSLPRYLRDAVLLGMA